MNFDDIKSRFDEIKNGQTYTLSHGVKGAIVGVLDKACGSKENRYQFAIALGCSPHSKDWTQGERWAMSKIVKVDKPFGRWQSTNEKFEQIIGAVMAKIGNNENQISMFEVTE